MAHRKKISRKRNPQIDYIETSDDSVARSICSFLTWTTKCNYLQKGIPDTCSWLSISMGRFLLNSAEVEQNLCKQEKIGAK